MAIPILQGFAVRTANAVDNRTVFTNGRAGRNALDAARLYQGLTVYYDTTDDSRGELWLLRDSAAFIADRVTNADTDMGWVQLDYSGTVPPVPQADPNLILEAFDADADGNIIREERAFFIHEHNTSFALDLVNGFSLLSGGGNQPLAVDFSGDPNDNAFALFLAALPAPTDAEHYMVSIQGHLGTIANPGAAFERHVYFNNDTIAGSLIAINPILVTDGIGRIQDPARNFQLGRTARPTARQNTDSGILTGYSFYTVDEIDISADYNTLRNLPNVFPADAIQFRNADGTARDTCLPRFPYDVNQDRLDNILFADITGGREVTILPSTAIPNDAEGLAPTLDAIISRFNNDQNRFTFTFSTANQGYTLELEGPRRTSPTNLPGAYVFNLIDVYDSTTLQPISVTSGTSFTGRTGDADSRITSRITGDNLHCISSAGDWDSLSGKPFDALNLVNPNLNIGGDNPDDEVNTGFGGIRTTTRDGVVELEVDTDELPLGAFGNVRGAYNSTNINSRIQGDVLRWVTDVDNVNGPTLADITKWGGLWSVGKQSYNDLDDVPEPEVFRDDDGGQEVMFMPEGPPEPINVDTVQRLAFFPVPAQNPRAIRSLITITPVEDNVTVRAALDRIDLGFTPTSNTFSIAWQTEQQRYIAILRGPRLGSDSPFTIPPSFINGLTYEVLEVYNNDPDSDDFLSPIMLDLSLGFFSFINSGNNPATRLTGVEIILQRQLASGVNVVRRDFGTVNAEEVFPLGYLIDTYADPLPENPTPEQRAAREAARREVYLNVSGVVQVVGELRSGTAPNFTFNPPTGLDWVQLSGTTGPAPAPATGSDSVRIVLQQNPIAAPGTYTTEATTDASTITFTSAGALNPRIAVNQGVEVTQGTDIVAASGTITAVEGMTFTVFFPTTRSFTAGEVTVSTIPVVFPGQILRTGATITGAEENSRYFLNIGVTGITANVTDGGLNNQEQWREISHQINFYTSMVAQYDSHDNNDISHFTVNPEDGDTPAFAYITFSNAARARAFIGILQNGDLPTLTNLPSAGRIDSPGTIHGTFPADFRFPNTPTILDFSFAESPAVLADFNFGWNYFPSSQTVGGLPVPAFTVRIALEENVAAVEQYLVNRTDGTSVVVDYLVRSSLRPYGTNNPNDIDIPSTEAIRLISQEEVIAGVSDRPTRTEVERDIFEFDQNTHVAHIESEQVSGTRTTTSFDLHQLNPLDPNADQDQRVRVDLNTFDTSVVMTDAHYAEMIAAFELSELDPTNLHSIFGQTLQANFNTGSVPVASPTALTGNWVSSYERTSRTQQFTENMQFDVNSVQNGSTITVAQPTRPTLTGTVRGVAQHTNGVGADITVEFEENVSFLSPFNGNGRALEGTAVEVTLTITATPLERGVFTINQVVENMVRRFVPRTSTNRRLSVSRIDRAGIAPNFGPFRQIPEDHRLLHIVDPSGPGGGNIDGRGYDFNRIELLYRTDPPSGSQGNGTGRAVLWRDVQTLPNRSGNQQGNRRTIRIAERFSSVGVNAIEYEIYSGATDVNSASSDANDRLVDDIYDLIQNPTNAPNVNQNVIDNLIGIEFFYDDNIPEPANPSIPVARTLIGYDNTNDAPNSDIFHLALAPGSRRVIEPTNPRSWIASGRSDDAGVRYLRTLAPQLIPGTFRSASVSTGTAILFESPNALPASIATGTEVRVDQGQLSVTGRIAAVVQNLREFTVEFSTSQRFVVGAVNVSIVPSGGNTATIADGILESNLHPLYRSVPSTSGRLDYYATSTGIIGGSRIQIPQIGITESDQNAAASLTVNGRDVPVVHVNEDVANRTVPSATQMLIGGTTYGIGNSIHAAATIPRAEGTPAIGEDFNQTTIPNGGIFIKTSDVVDTWRVHNSDATSTARWRNVVNPATLTSEGANHRIVVERIRIGASAPRNAAGNIIPGSFNGILLGNVFNYQSSPFINSPSSGQGVSFDNFRINRADFNLLETQRLTGDAPNTQFEFSELSGDPGVFPNEGWQTLDFRFVNPIAGDAVVAQINAPLVRIRSINSPSSSAPGEFLFMEFASGTISNPNFFPLDTLTNVLSVLNADPNHLILQGSTDYRPRGQNGEPAQIWALQVNVPTSSTRQQLTSRGMYQFNSSNTTNGEWSTFSNSSTDGTVPNINATV